MNSRKIAGNIFSKTLNIQTSWHSNLYAPLYMLWWSGRNMRRHQMDIFSALLASDADLWYHLWSVWTNTWVNKGDAGDLRRHRAHYDVTLMKKMHSRRRQLINVQCHIGSLAMCVAMQTHAHSVEYTSYVCNKYVAQSVHCLLSLWFVLMISSSLWHIVLLPEY